MTWDVRLGDCIETMRAMPEASVDAVVTDPPYELGFMGKRWDASGIAFSVALWREVLRVLKPGGYILAFSGTRTYHRMTCAIEDAGAEIRDCIGWQYGSGFPKSLSVSRSIEGMKNGRGARYSASDPDLSVESGTLSAPGTQWQDASARTMADGASAWTGGKVNVTDPDAKTWTGWGTALKPAWEPVVVARKPLDGTVAANVLKHGTGAMNIDACRIEGGSWVHPASNAIGGVYGDYANDRPRENNAGRWPANVLFTHAYDCDESGCAEGCPCAALDAQSGGDGASRFFNRLPIEADDLVPFYYTAKASRSEREAGCDDLEERSGAEAVEREEGSAGTQSPRAGAGRTASSVRNHHPTVKPIAVMRHLVRLVTPPGGTVLDPFTGSGSTGCAAVLEGKAFIGCEMQPEYVEIARARIAHHGKQVRLG